MARMLYCKKCRKDVPPGMACPDCGKVPPASSTRNVWVMTVRPARDWMRWNAVMRIVMPVLISTLMLGVLLDLMIEGIQGLRGILSGSFLWMLTALVALMFLGTLGLLLLGGEEEVYHMADSQGLHVRTTLPGANRWKLWARGRSVRMMEQADLSGRIILSERNLGWKEIARVQLWEDKRMILLYQPTWWLKMPLRCTTDSWGDMLALLDEKIGKRKDVCLPTDWAMYLPPKKETSRAKDDFSNVPPQPSLPRGKRQGKEEDSGAIPPKRNQPTPKKGGAKNG